MQIFGSKLFEELEIFIQKSCLHEQLLIIGVRARKIWGGGEQRQFCLNVCSQQF